MRNKILLIVFIFLCILPAAPLMRAGYFPMHDDMQAMRVHQMTICFKDWQIPCRWVPDMGYGYGYPQFNYYPPLPYYVMTLIHLTGIEIIDSVKIGFILSFVIAGVGMFLLTEKLWGRPGAIVSTLFYLYLPYRAVNVYDRGAMGEIWAMAFFPWIIWSMERIWHKNNKSNIATFAISLACLMTSHSLSTLMIAPFIIIWWIVRTFQHRHNFKTNLFDFLVAGLLGIGLSAYYVFPSLIEKSSAHLETMTMGYFNYLAHFATIRQIFSNTHWGYGSSILGPYDDMSLSVGLWHWIVLVLAWLILLIKFYRTKQFMWVNVLIISGLGYLFLAHQKSTPIWNMIPTLEWLQFPWRFLAPASFVFCIAIGSIFYNFKKASILILILLITPLVFLNISYMKPRIWFPMTDKIKFSQDLWEKQQTISIFDYLPKSAKFPPSNRAPDKPWFTQGSGEIVSFQKGSNWQTTKLIAQNNSVVAIPLFYFPGWKVTVNNKVVAINSVNELGLITFEVPSGESLVNVRLGDTPVRFISNALTLLSVIILLSLLFRVEKILNYVSK